MSRRDEVMRPYMSRAGTWEPEEGRLLCWLVRPGERFLDIGANVGYFSVLVGKAAPGVSVDAVEPDPNNVRALEFNLWVNRVEAHVWPLALDDNDRSLLLSGHQTNLGDLRCDRVVTSSNGNAPRRRRRRAMHCGHGWYPLPQGTSCSLGARSISSRSTCKGGNFAVLSGLTDVLDRSPGVRIVAEFQPNILRSQHRVPQEVLSSYRHRGYRIRSQVGDQLLDQTDEQIVELCDTAGSNGAVNLLLER